MFKKKNNKGFTLMEMLIVVAIIAILVAIAIPTFSGSLDKARKETDKANIRAAYAEAVAEYLSGETGKKTTATMQSKGEITLPDGLTSSGDSKLTVEKGATYTITVTEDETSGNIEATITKVTST